MHWYAGAAPHDLPLGLHADQQCAIQSFPSVSALKLADAANMRAGRPSGQYSCYLSVVCMFQNEAPYLEEWLAFCISEGVVRFLLYDNASTDESREVLRPWIDAGIVELIDWPVHFEKGAQLKAYADALQRTRGRTRWAAFIDVDEFLFSPSGRRVADVLKAYEHHAGIVVNWQCYGSSGHETRPAGLTIESYTRRARTNWARNRRVKTIIDPAMATEPRSVHLFAVRPGQSLVTEDFRPVRIVRSRRGRNILRHLVSRLPYVSFEPYALTESSSCRVSVETLRINHYVTRSNEEAALKYKDRSTMGVRDRRSYTRYHDRNEVEDPILSSRAKRVREIIARVHAGQGRSLVNRSGE